MAGVESVWLELRHCHCLRNEMAHFCTDLQTYIMFEVLETAWDIFMAQLQVIPARPQFLTHCAIMIPARVQLQVCLQALGSSHFETPTSRMPLQCRQDNLLVSCFIEQTLLMASMAR